MAIRFARRARPVAVVAALAATALIVPGLASADPAPKPTSTHKPSISSVQQQLNQLAQQNSQLVEQYNQAKLLVAKRHKQAATAKAAAVQAAADYRKAHAEFAEVIQAQYESEPVGTAGALLSSDSDTNYIDRLNSLSLLSQHDAQVVTLVTQARGAARTRAVQAKQALSAAQAQQTAVQQKKQSVQKDIAKYQDLLATLSAAQQAAYQKATDPKVTKTTQKHIAKLVATGATNAQAKKAVQFALDQVGKPYVFGAAGPGSYDCSGLTMAAWHAAGVNLPHSALQQYSFGHHVDRSDLQPGDLIFFYQPIGHVTIYIGGGQMVSAPTSGQNVTVVPLSHFNSDYAGATRLVG